MKVGELDCLAVGLVVIREMQGLETSFLQSKKHF